MHSFLIKQMSEVVGFFKYLLFLIIVLGVFAWLLLVGFFLSKSKLCKASQEEFDIPA